MNKFTSLAFAILLGFTVAAAAQNKKVSVAAIESETTAATVECNGMVFESALQVPDKDSVSMTCTFTFNGFAGTVGDRVTFARNASTTVKQTAVRVRVNELLGSLEPGNSLNNANIQVSGLPI